MKRALHRRRGAITTPLIVMITTIAAFVAVAFSLTLRLRADLRTQILGREAAALRSMVALQEARAQEEFAALAGTGLGGAPEDLFPLLLETARLSDVIALRLFDAGGVLRDALPVPLGAHVAAGDWQRLATGEGFARLHPRVVPASVRVGDPDTQGPGAVPLLEVLVPLHRPADRLFTGAAQYWIDGAPMQREFTRLDRHLWWRSGLAAVIGAGIVLAALAWAFRQLQARNADLARANREFSLAAKTSAIGTITAHLLHGLKNPIAGLEGYVANHTLETRPTSEASDDREKALQSAQRIRALVNEIVDLLQEEQSGATYRVPLREVLGTAAGKIRELADERGVTFTWRGAADRELPGRQAHLALLVLDNLLRNACEALPHGGSVTLHVACNASDAIFVVEDNGTGLPDAVRGQLFQPITSTKPGGGGIGLVLSHELARHAGGRLTLERSDVAGCRFRLAVPLETTAPLTSPAP